MAGVTTALMAAGMAANAIQMVDAQKKKQESEFEAKNQAAKLSQVEETDYMAAMQVPMLAYDLASQAAMARSAEAINALQGAGTEAVLGGVPSVVQQGMQQDLQIAAALGEAEYQNELIKAKAKQGIETRRVEREQDIAESRLKGAQLSALSATQNRNQAAKGFIDLAAQGAVGYDASRPLYETAKTTGAPGVGVDSASAGLTNRLSGSMGGGLTSPSSVTIPPTVGQMPMQVPSVSPVGVIQPTTISSPSLTQMQLETIYGIPMGSFSSFGGTK
jgi:hypothetical protein